MSPIYSVDNQTAFFPIKQNNNIPNNINTDNVDNVSTNVTGNSSEFQMILKSLLDNMMNHGSNLSGLNVPGENASSSVPDGENDVNRLLFLLDQKEQFGNPTSLVSEVPYARMISKYKQAMNDFRNAFNLQPVGTPEEQNIHTINRIINGETGVVQNLSGAGTPGVNPTRQEVADYITEQCQAIGIPTQLGLATAATESDLKQFNKDGMTLRGSNSDSTDWGIMQVNDKAWGDIFDFSRIKSDWKYNVRAGLQILKDSYNAAAKNNEGSKGANSSLENLARAAYSGYNAGTGNIWRYRTSIDNAPKMGPYDVLSNEGYDIRDIRFWNNYQKFS